MLAAKDFVGTPQPGRHRLIAAGDVRCHYGKGQAGGIRRGHQ